MEPLVTILLLILGIAWLGVVFVGPPYVPTLNKDLEVLFRSLQLGAGDHVVDLGAGDGRVLKKVARAGAKATGVEINPMLSWIARWRLRRTNAQVVTKNMWYFDLPDDVSYVFIFCASKYIVKMDQYLDAQVRKGRHFRLISYGFTLSQKAPDTIIGSFNIYDF